MRDTLLAVLYSLRVQDLLDIAVIFFLVYGILLWFKQTASRFVLIGIALLATVYGLARYFQLYLTAMILQGFFAILLLALVVIFQEELRRFFERLATWGRFRKERIGAPSQKEVDVLVETAASLARKRIGALIVVKGEEPLDRHLEGGVELDGALSQPLLESIFDPHSGGHDGAAVVHKGRVIRFACRLPLSPQADRFGLMGLRHTAALGLSERSDALCIVVSEERGTISLAQGGQIVVLAGPRELKEALEKFYGPRPSEKPPSGLARVLKRNFWEKAAALVAACLLWLAFGYQRGPVGRHFVVPIEYRNLPAEWIIEEPRVSEAEILLTGPEQAFLLLDPARLRISLDLSNVKEGKQKIRLSREMIPLPSSLTLESIKPDSIQIAAYRLLRVDAPVEVPTKGALPKGLSLVRIEAVPPALTVLVPPNLKDKGVKIQTEPVDLAEIAQNTVLFPRLVVPADVRFADPKQPSVRVIVEVAPSGQGNLRP